VDVDQVMVFWVFTPCRMGNMLPPFWG